MREKEFEYAETSFIKRRLKRAVIREELIEITGDFLEGLILGQMLYWTERVRFFEAFLREEMQRSESNIVIEETTEPLKGWFSKTAKQLNEELMLKTTVPTIRARLKSLVKKGLLFERDNPYQKRDRAKQYRVSVLHLVHALEEKGHHLEGYPILSGFTSKLSSLKTISKINIEREEPLSKDNGNGSNEPCISSNNSSSWDTYNMSIEEIKKNDFVLISIPQKEQLPTTAKAEQELDRTEVKTTPQTSMTDRVRRNLPKSNGASRIMKSEQLPAREAMPQCLQTWFTLPLVTKPTVKTYHRIVRLIHQLEQGRFPSQYKSLNIDFVEQQKIKPEHLTKKWFNEELSNLLDGNFRSMIEDGACWPENKEKYFKGLSFESFVLNKKTGRSWLLGLLLQPPQLLRKINTKQTIDHDSYPQCTYEIAEALEISKKTNPDEYAGIARNFSKLVQFFQLLPVEEGHERDGIFKFVNHPQTIANSLVGFFEEHYSWAISKGAHPGLLSLKGKPIRKWLEDWNDQPILLPGRKKPSCILDLLDEYNQYGKIRIAVPESTQVIERNIQEEEEVPPKPTATELRQREEEAVKYLAPDDIIRIDEEKPEKGTMMSKLKAALARLKQGIPDPVVDESYAGF